MERYLKQLSGQDRVILACTHRSGPLPASLASATCPLLRGTLEGAGASCALTGTRGTGWSGVPAHMEPYLNATCMLLVLWVLRVCFGYVGRLRTHLRTQ